MTDAPTPIRSVRVAIGDRDRDLPDWLTRRDVELWVAFNQAAVAAHAAQQHAAESLVALLDRHPAYETLGALLVGLFGLTESEADALLAVLG